MHLDQRKEQFSRAYVHAVAAVAGVRWAQPNVDDQSVDLMLTGVRGENAVRSPRLDVQIKAHAATTPSEPEFSFRLKQKNYDDLRDADLHVPRILVVVLVPEELGEWLTHIESEMALRRCGYWLSLRGLPPSGNQTGKTVSLRRDQTFTPDALSAMMEKIGRRDWP